MEEEMSRNFIFDVVATGRFDDLRELQCQMELLFIGPLFVAAPHFDGRMS